MLINTNREDIRWIKAVLLNAYTNPPAEIQNEILKNSDFFNLEIKELITKFPESLLLDCLHVHFGHPQPLWWLAVHHHNKKFWNKVVRFILYKKKHPYYSLCLRELLSNGVNGFTPDWADGFKIWKSICRRPHKRTEQVKRLIYETAKSNCSIDSTSKLWKILIKSFQRQGKEEELIDLVVNHIEFLQQTGDKKDLLDFWGSSYTFKKILPRIQPDYLIMTLIEQVINSSESENTAIELISTFQDKQDGYRFFFTSLLVKRVIDKYPLSESFKTVIASINHCYKDVEDNETNILEKELEEDIFIYDWIGS